MSRANTDVTLEEAGELLERVINVVSYLAHPLGRGVVLGRAGSTDIQVTLRVQFSYDGCHLRAVWLDWPVPRALPAVVAEKRSTEDIFIRPPARLRKVLADAIVDDGHLRSEIDGWLEQEVFVYNVSEERRISLMEES